MVHYLLLPARGFSSSSINAAHYQHPLIAKPWLMLLNWSSPTLPRTKRLNFLPTEHTPLLLLMSSANTLWSFQPLPHNKLNRNPVSLLERSQACCTCLCRSGIKQNNLVTSVTFLIVIKMCDIHQKPTQSLGNKTTTNFWDFLNS